METRRSFLKTLFGAGIATALPEVAEAGSANAPYSIIDNYSKKNRGKRSKTYFIVLHTTEGGASGALNELKTHAKAHYLVQRNGTIHRTVPHGNIAIHAGYSRWNGIEDLNKNAVGIETEGYHYLEPTTEQLASLRWLVGELKSIYNLTDDKVITHSMCRYFPADKWGPKRRGRPCGMLFALAQYRRAIGLNNVFRADPDVANGILAFGDKYLAEVLYSPNTPPIFTLYPQRDPRADRYVRGLRGKPKASTPQIAQTKKADVALDGRLYRKPAGTVYSQIKGEYNKKTTVYAFRGADKWVVFTGLEIDKYLDMIPVGAFLCPHHNIGVIGAGDSAYKIAKKKWDSPHTVYLLPEGTDLLGDEIDPVAIPPQTIIIY